MKPRVDVRMCVLAILAYLLLLMLLNNSCVFHNPLAPLASGTRGAPISPRVKWFRQRPRL
jgi:hypothetical protein